MSAENNHNSKQTAGEKPLLVLAYSGGLDTSYCVLQLKQDYRVHTVTVDTGGFDAAELEALEERASALGAERHTTLLCADVYYASCLRYLIFGNALRGNVYPLSVSAERAIQVEAIARFALSAGADYVAHGSTGAGNDQVRFDMAFNSICPDIPIITPIRDAGVRREDAVAALRAAGDTSDWTRAPYSINKGLWGTSVGGHETLTSDQPLPEAAWPTPVSKTVPETLTLEFKQGEPFAIDGATFNTPAELISALQERTQPFGIGRDIHVGDSIVGLKGRVGFEAAAPLIILKAHHLLEKHVLTARQATIKERLAAEYAALLHEGHFGEQAMRNIEAFLTDSQKFVDGKVFVHCAPHRFELLGVESPHDLMRAEFGAYGEGGARFSGTDVRGFAKVASNAAAVFNHVHVDLLNSNAERHAND